jgi:FtsH-binding integral membrane protein
MPTNKHKRKASAHPKSNKVNRAQSSGLISSHPKAFFSVGLFFVLIGVYLLTFKSESNSMFGFAMLSLLAGVVTTFYAKFMMPKNK